MGRMQLGRFPTRAEALDFLVAKFSTKKMAARYSITEEDTSRVTFMFVQDFPNGKKGEVHYVGNGADMSEAIRDLFTKLGEKVD